MLINQANKVDSGGFASCKVANIAKEGTSHTIAERIIHRNHPKTISNKLIILNNLPFERHYSMKHRQIRLKHI